MHDARASDSDFWRTVFLLAHWPQPPGLVRSLFLHPETRFLQVILTNDHGERELLVTVYPSEEALIAMLDLWAAHVRASLASADQQPIIDTKGIGHG
ncbi:MAG: hypothetical protein IRY99_24960 [Isosphaeraceae bacterium]|nr:hypothetical protein [Isosphaeraceae bacterium]